MSSRESAIGGAAARRAGGPQHRRGVSSPSLPAAGADHRCAAAAPFGRRFIEDEEGRRFDYVPAPVARRSLLRDGAIHIEGEITTTDCSAALVREALAAWPKGLPITIVINSNGGAIPVAHAIVTALKNDPRPVTARIFDQAWSCGALVALAADRVEIGPLGSIGIHCARFVDIEVGTAARLRAMAAELDEADAVILDILAARLRYSRGWIFEAMLNSRGWVGEDAVAAGLADALIEDPRITERECNAAA